MDHIVWSSSKKSLFGAKDMKTSSSHSVGSTGVASIGVASIDSEARKYEVLKDIMEKNCSENLPIITLNPNDDDKEEFTPTEIAALDQRDFKMRLFISALHSTENSFWVRTHHTDTTEHAMKSAFSFVEDYFEAAYACHNHVAAKATLTACLATLFEMSKSDYYTFATIMASGLSREGTHTSFEIDNALLKEAKDVTIARRRLLLLMDIIFNKIAVKRFLIDDGHVNIFRLIHCDTKGRRNKRSFMYAIFSFMLQACLVAFVVFDALNGVSGFSRPQQLQIGLWILAGLGAVFGLFALLPDIVNMKRVFAIYGKIGPLQMVDFVVNVVMPLALVFIGGYLVSVQDNYINAVIMTTALLFISEIDDQLPKLLGLNVDVIVENFLIRESKIDYNEYQALDDSTVHAFFSGSDVETQIASRKFCYGVDFSDYFITNSIEDHDTSMYQPFSVRRSNEFGHEIDPSDFISDDCVLKSVEWRYTNKASVDSTLCWLRLVKMSGEVIELDYGCSERGDSYRIDGAFIITNFVTSSTYISSLRLCGSDDGKSLLKALEYYTLWEMTSDAREMLER